MAAPVFTISSTVECIVDGIGKLDPNTPKVLDGSHLQQFRAMHGYDLVKAKFPTHISLWVKIAEGRENL